MAVALPRSGRAEAGGGVCCVQRRAREARGEIKEGSAGRQRERERCARGVCIRSLGRLEVRAGPVLSEGGCERLTEGGHTDS